MCVDLQALYGTRLKLRREADGVTWSTTPEPERIWLLEIPCKHGVVYPTGGNVLAAVVTGRRIGHQIAALPGIRSSRGDIERVVTFHIDDAEPVLALLKPHRRRQVSPEEQARLAAIGERHRFAGAQVPKTGLESTRASVDDPEGQPGLEVGLADAEVVPSAGTGALLSSPADECDAPGYPT
jgi:hypothetical protein